MEKRLLVEYIPFEYNQTQILLESQSNPAAPIKVKAILQRANAKNQNGRVYGKDILLREAERYNQEFVMQRRALGQCDHPDSETVELKDVSHNVTEMHWEGDDLIGTIELLSTPSGNIVKELMKNGIRLGISSRGMGSMQGIGENTYQVNDDFHLICFDIVANPSVQGAFINESVGGNGVIVEKYAILNELVHNFLVEIGS